MTALDVDTPARREGPPEAWQPRPYTQLLRGPRHRWWRPLVALAVALGAALVLFGLVAVVSVVLVASTGGIDAVQADPLAAAGEPPLFLANNLLLAGLIPLAWLAVWAGHRWRPRWVSSVVGGIRWRWLAVATGTALLVMAPFLLLPRLLSGGWPGVEGEDVALLLAIVLLTTPFQAAGEEYLTRGWMSQAIGSWFARAGVGALVAALVTAAFFGLMHGTGDRQSLLLFADRFAFGLIASWLVWRTGGLEAPIAVHAVNNIVILVPTVLAGTLAEDVTMSDAPLSSVLLDVAMLVSVGLVLALVAHRLRVQRLFVPPALPGQGGPQDPVRAAVP